MDRATRIGLDYLAVEAVMRLQVVKKSARAEMFNEIQAMEAAALEVFNAEA